MLGSVYALIEEDIPVTQRVQHVISICKIQNLTLLDMGFFYYSPYPGSSFTIIAQVYCAHICQNWLRRRAARRLQPLH